MKISIRIAITIIAGLTIIACTRKSSDFILACGGDEVFIANISFDVPQKVWSWKEESAVGLPAYMKYKFLTTDECKPVDKGKKILITSSGGGVALIDRLTNKTLFYASAPNAHSAEVLPSNLLVTAASFNPEGNRLILYSIDSSNVVIDSDSLFGAHGVYWDKKSELLWALGTEELRSYTLVLTDEVPKLQLKDTYALPENDGHDLVPTDHKKILSISTANNVWNFDTRTLTFQKHPDLGDMAKVKSISYSSINNKIVYVKAPEDSWWAYYIRFTDSNRVVYFPGEKIYKARWLY